MESHNLYQYSVNCNRPAFSVVFYYDKAADKKPESKLRFGFLTADGFED